MLRSSLPAPRSPLFPLLFALQARGLAICVVAVLSACSMSTPGDTDMAPSSDVDLSMPGDADMGPGDTDGGNSNSPCSCTVGSRRCVGTGVQICEALSPTCPTWGPIVSCPTGTCNSGTCNAGCLDSCYTPGAVRCGRDGGRQVCRINGSGCTDWVTDSCTAGTYCSDQTCVASVPCAISCPAGFTCQPNGTCQGGLSEALALDVKTVKLSGSVTFNGLLPQNSSTVCSTTINSTSRKFFINLYDEKSGNNVAIRGDACSKNTFDFSGAVPPGTYRVAVISSTVYDGMSRFVPASNLPVRNQPSVSDTPFTIVSDTANKVFDVKGFRLSGTITHNGMAPSNVPAFCSASNNPEKPKFRVYVTTLDGKVMQDLDVSRCDTDLFEYSGYIPAGTYRIGVVGLSADYRFPSQMTTLPEDLYWVETAFAVAGDTVGKTLNLSTVRVSGSIQLNGANPTATAACTALMNPSTPKAVVFFADSAKDMSFHATVDSCNTSTWTYSARVATGGNYIAKLNTNYDGSRQALSNLPGPYYSEPVGVINADTNGRIINAKLFTVSGSVTINGISPVPDSAICSSTFNPMSDKFAVYLDGDTQLSVAATVDRCGSNTFNYSAMVSPGIYRIRVRTQHDGTLLPKPMTNLPSVDWVADPGFVVAANVSGKIVDVKAVRFAGTITLNGASPQRSASCDGVNNATFPKAAVVLSENTTYSGTIIYSEPCATSTFRFSAFIAPGRYTVKIRGLQGAGKEVLTDLLMKPNRDPLDYFVDLDMPILADTTNQALDMKTVSVKGIVLNNGVTPQNDATLCTMLMNSATEKTKIVFFDPIRRYSFDVLGDPCSVSTFNFGKQTIFSGTYAIGVMPTAVDRSGSPASLSNIPDYLFPSSMPNELMPYPGAYVVTPLVQLP